MLEPLQVVAVTSLPSGGRGRRLEPEVTQDGRGDEAGQERDSHDCGGDGSDSGVGVCAHFVEEGAEGDGEEQNGDGVYGQDEGTQPADSAATEITKGYEREVREDKKGVDGNADERSDARDHGPEGGSGAG